MLRISRLALLGAWWCLSAACANDDDDGDGDGVAETSSDTTGMPAMTTTDADTGHASGDIDLSTTIDPTTAGGETTGMPTTFATTFGPGDTGDTDDTGSSDIAQPGDDSGTSTGDGSTGSTG